MTADTDERYDRLLLTMARLVDLLRRVGDSWADSVERSRELIERGDGYGLERFLGMFGGMGSLNDVFIHPRHDVEDSEARSLNEEFQELKSSAWSDAVELRRDLDRRQGGGRGSTLG